MTSSQRRAGRKRELSGLLRFGRETLAAFGLALVVIVYGVQAFRIPSGSMEDSLLIGDQLLGLKFTYGSPVLPFTYLKFPGIRDPQPGDVVIFRSPDNSGKDFVKRCVAGPGQTVEIRGERLFIDGELVTLPPDAKHVFHGNNEHPAIEHFRPLRVPAEGDTIRAADLGPRELLFLKHLIHQEHPYADVRVRLDLRVDGRSANNVRFLTLGTAGFRRPRVSIDHINGSGMIDSLDQWVTLAAALDQLRSAATSAFEGSNVALVPTVMLDDEPVHTYVVRHDAYFMLGDNRDNSLDSRYWGFVSRKFVKAQALIIYASLDPDTPLWLLPWKVRWNRVGKLIRGWDGIPAPNTEAGRGDGSVPSAVVPAVS